MIQKLAISLVVSSVLLLGASFWQSWLGSDPVAVLLPNLIVGLFILGVSLFIAEILIRRHRADSGIADVSPYLLKTISPALNLDQEIVTSLDYTPNEFELIHIDYLKGRMDPVHLPAKFKERVKDRCALITPESFQEAQNAIEAALQKIEVFSSVLEPQHILVLDRAVENWKQFSAAHAEPDPDKAKIAEAFMDAHDSICDIYNLFKFEEAIKAIQIG